MITLSKYAEKKFDYFHKYKVFITKEQVNDAVSSPDKITKLDGHKVFEKDGLRVICKEAGGNTTVITFYPVKEKES